MEREWGGGVSGGGGGEGEWGGVGGGGYKIRNCRLKMFCALPRQGKLCMPPLMGWTLFAPPFCMAETFSTLPLFVGLKLYFTIYTFTIWFVLLYHYGKVHTLDKSGSWLSPIVLPRAESKTNIKLCGTMDIMILLPVPHF